MCKLVLILSNHFDILQTPLAWVCAHYSYISRHHHDFTRSDNSSTASLSLPKLSRAQAVSLLFPRGRWPSIILFIMYKEDQQVLGGIVRRRLRCLDAVVGVDVEGECNDDFPRVSCF